MRVIEKRKREKSFETSDRVITFETKLYKIMKQLYKSDFKEILLKLATNGRSDKLFLLTSTFRAPWYIHV